MNNLSAVDQGQVFNAFVKEFNIAGKKVLEVGGAIPEKWIAARGVESWTAVDPLNIDYKSNNYSTIKSPIQDAGIERAGFDFIFSSNAFHHISELQRGILKMAEALKPNGILYAHFGPIWSGPDGSHLENVAYKGRLINFWDSPYVPNWYHLLYDEKELCDILSSALEKELAETITAYVFRSKWISRLFFDDYLRIIYESPFNIELLCCINNIDYIQNFPCYSHPLIAPGTSYEEILGRIQERHGSDKKNILCRDLKIILRR